jgi:hypothetical protein
MMKSTENGLFFRAMEFLTSEQPILEGCLKEKKGKWRLFKRWRTRYFTLSGGQLQAKGVINQLQAHYANTFVELLRQLIAIRLF